MSPCLTMTHGFKNKNSPWHFRTTPGILTDVAAHAEFNPGTAISSFENGEMSSRKSRMNTLLTLDSSQHDATYRTRSTTRFEYPHSLSYQDNTLTMLPPITFVDRASITEEAGLPLKSTDTRGCSQ